MVTDEISLMNYLFHGTSDMKSCYSWETINVKTKSYNGKEGCMHN
jgi:hypothetical protein